MQYAYSQQAMTNAGVPSNWHAFNDPALIATLPAAALLYRRGDVRESVNDLCLCAHSRAAFQRADFARQCHRPAHRIRERKAGDRLPKTPELPWLDPSPIPSGAKFITDPRVSLLDANATGATSDTGELRRDWDHGTYTIDTPRTQAAMGWIGGRDITLTDIRMSINTRNATVAVQSLDANAPISALPRYHDLARRQVGPRDRRNRPALPFRARHRPPVHTRAPGFEAHCTRWHRGKRSARSPRPTTPAAMKSPWMPASAPTGSC